MWVIVQQSLEMYDKVFTIFSKDTYNSNDDSDTLFSKIRLQTAGILMTA